MDHRYGLQRGWENNSALEGYGHVDEPDFRVDGSYDDRRFVDDRHVSENGYSRSAYHRDIVERERYPVQPVGPWPQARRGGYGDEYPVERESRHHEKAYADTYSDIGSRRMDSYRDHGFYRSSQFTGRDDEDYGYDDYDYRTRISSREDIRERERDYDYGRYSYDSDYERSRRDGSRRRRDSHDHSRSKESEEKDQSPYRRRGGSRSSSRGHDDRLRSSSRGHDDRLRSSSRGHDDRLRSSSRGHDDRQRSSSRGYDDRLRSSSRGHDDRLRSSSRGQDYRLRSRSPQRRSHSRSQREDSYDNIHYERSDKGRDHEGRHHRDLFSVAPSATVVVKGLSHKTTEEDLYQILAEWGPLRHVRVIKERDSGISRGFAFLDFPTVGAAQTMMDKLGDEGLVVDGRKLFFEYSSKPTGSASGPLGSDNVSRSGYGSHRTVAVPSDWMCTFCGCVNFARRTSCFQCNEPRTDDAPPADMASSNPVPGKRGEAGPTHVLVVRGLDENADEEILRYEFSKHAPIKDLRLVRDKFTHVSRGFAFVHFYSIEDATKALEATNGTTLEKNGQILRVAYAKSVLGPGSGPSGATQSSSLAAAAIEAATFSQQYDAVGWTPKEYNPEDKQSTGGQGHGAGVHGQSGAGPGAPQSNFVWDESSGYYYDASSGFYYDGNTGLYYDGNNGIWYTYDHQTQQYAPFSDQNDKASEKQSEAAVDGGSSKRKVVISAPAATINLTAKAVASLPDAIHAAASAAIAAEKKEKEKAKEIKLASKSSILANKKKMNNVLTMWKHRSHEGGQAPRVALDDNPVPSATTPEDRGNATAGSSSMKTKFKTELVITKENVAVSAGFSTGEESQDRANKSGGGGTLKGVIRGSGFGVVKSDTLYTGNAANSVGLGSSSSLSNMDSSFVVTPFRTDSSALGSYAPPVTGRRRFSEMPTQPSPVSNKEQRQTTYRDRAAERRSLYGSSSSLGDISETGDSNRDSTHRRIATDSMPFPPGVGVGGGGGGGGRGAGDDNVQSFEVITADRAIDESNVGNRMLRNMGWQEGLGLGKDGSGMVEPVQAQSVEKRAGLGSQPKKTTDPSLEVQSGDSYKTLIQKKAIARFREMP